MQLFPTTFVQCIMYYICQYTNKNVKSKTINDCAPTTTLINHKTLYKYFEKKFIV